MSSRPDDENSFGTGMCRHDQWLQAIDHVSKWKIELPFTSRKHPRMGVSGYKPIKKNISMTDRVQGGKILEVVCTPKALLYQAGLLVNASVT